MSDKKQGFFAKLMGKKEETQGGGDPTLEQRLKAAEDKVAEFEGIEVAAEEKFTALEKERDAAVAAKGEAETAKGTAEGRVTALEKERDDAVKAKGEAEKAKTEAEGKVKKFEEEMPAKIASGVKDQLASLGVDPEKLPANDNTGGQGGKDAPKGRARAAAAFSAALAN